MRCGNVRGEWEERMLFRLHHFTWGWSAATLATAAVATRRAVERERRIIVGCCGVLAVGCGVWWCCGVGRKEGKAG